MGAAENRVETCLNTEIEYIDGITRKWVSPGRNGVPDRIVVFNGIVIFVEVKTDSGKLSSVQIREQEKLRDSSANVTTVYGTSGVTSFVQHLQKAYRDYQGFNFFSQLKKEYR